MKNKERANKIARTYPKKGFKPRGRNDFMPKPQLSIEMLIKPALVIAIVAIVVLAFMLSSAHTSNAQAEQQTLAAEAQLAGANAQIFALDTEKNRTQNDLLAERLAKLTAQKSVGDAATALLDYKAQEFERMVRLKNVLDGQPFNTTQLNKTKAAYKQWDDYACSFYLGANLLTSGGTVTVPLQCVITTGQYMFESKKLSDSLTSISDRGEAGLAELQRLYPALNTTN